MKPINEPDDLDGWEEYDGDDEPFDDEFEPCSECDGHPACEDFGCAIKLGLGYMVKKDDPK